MIKSFIGSCFVIMACAACTPAKKTPYFTHVALYVSDIARSTQFYKEAFGLIETKRFDRIEIVQGDSSFERDVKVVFLRLQEDGFILELIEGQTPPRDSIGIPLYQHLGIVTNNFDLAFQKAVSNGAKPSRPIRHLKAADFEMNQSFFTGPDGESIEVVQFIKGTY